MAVSDCLTIGANELANQRKFHNYGSHDSCWSEPIQRELVNAYNLAYSTRWSHMPNEHRRVPIRANVKYKAKLTHFRSYLPITC
jgi:hypothetical protein